MAPVDSGTDVLFDVKNAFYLGNFQQCITEAQKLRPTNEEVMLERNCFLYRLVLWQFKKLI